MLTNLPVLILALAGCLCIALSIIDMRQMVLPTPLVVLLGAAGVGFHWATGWSYVSPAQATVGAMTGSVIFLAIRTAYTRLRGSTAIGLGDVKFMIAAGIWVGAINLPLMILIASVTTLIAVGTFNYANDVSLSSIRKRRVPFGPGLSVGLIFTVVEILLYPSAY